MGHVVYVSEVRLEKKKGPLRTAWLPAETEPVSFGVHGAVAEHYGIDEARLKEVHATTLDYVVASAGG